jgi:hypothetical protein
MNHLAEIAPYELYWLAGLLEGEGCFSARLNGGFRDILVTVQMTDRDVVEKVQRLTGIGTVGVKRDKRPNRKTLYEWYATGANAYQLMQRLLPLMGERRAAKITELIQIYLAAREEGRARRSQAKGSPEMLAKMAAVRAKRKSTKEQD